MSGLQAYDLEYSSISAGIEHVDDSLSPEVFAIICDRYGIVPYRKSILLGSPDASSSSASIDVEAATGVTDEDEFVPVRRLTVKPRKKGAAAEAAFMHEGGESARTPRK